MSNKFFILLVLWRHMLLIFPLLFFYLEFYFFKLLFLLSSLRVLHGLFIILPSLWSSPISAQQISMHPYLFSTLWWPWALGCMVFLWSVVPLLRVFKEEPIFLSLQLPVANRFSGRGETSCPPPHSRQGFCLAWACTDLNVCSQSLWAISSCVSRRSCFGVFIQHLWLINPFHLLFYNDTRALRGGVWHSGLIWGWQFLVFYYLYLVLL